MSASFLDRLAEDLEDPGRKRTLNRLLFTEIAAEYDAVSRALSFGRDSHWKAQLVARLPAVTAPRCLDLACGTGDLTRRLAARYPDGEVVGLDLTEAMIAQARQLGAPCNVRFGIADMAATGEADGSVDLVTGGYALRNAGDLAEALREVWRVLRPGGTVAFLDFSKPASLLPRAVQDRLLRLWGGLWGWALHRDPRFYTYIAHSLERFPHRLALRALFVRVGFDQVSEHRHFGGMAATVTAVKPAPERSGDAGAVC